MVTSAMPKDGKTLTVSNLALTLSESYQQHVLLIDADLRRPSIQNQFDIRPTVLGLCEFLRSETNSPAFVQLTDRLTVLPAGRPDDNPMDTLTSNRMKQLLEDAAKQFEWVLVDTPPVGLLPDASLIARLVDGVLFVIGAGSTPYQHVQRAIAEIGPERVLGTILNRAEISSIPESGYYQGYGYSSKKHRPSRVN